MGTTDSIDQFGLLILAGVLTQLAIEKVVEAELVSKIGFLENTEVAAIEDVDKMCKHNGAGYWSELSLLSLTFAVICGLRASSEKLLRSSLIFMIMFVLILMMSDFGRHAIRCAGFDDKKRIFEYASIAISALIAVAITVRVIIGPIKQLQ